MVFGADRFPQICFAAEGILHGGGDLSRGSVGYVMIASHEIRSSSEEETIELGTAIGEFLRAGDTILLLGELGSGKTRLAKGIISAAACIPDDEVVSPTFTLMNRFEGQFPVYHADLYRLEPDQIEGIGLEDAFEENGALIVEWAEKMTVMDADPLKISIYYAESRDGRLIVLEWLSEGSWHDRMAGVAARWPLEQGAV